MTNYSAWDSRAEALAREAEEEDKRAEAESNEALGLADGPRGPATARAEAELSDLGQHSRRRQDFIEWSSSREVTVTHEPREEPIELSSADVEGKALCLLESEGVTYVLSGGLVKVMLDRCRCVRLRIEGGVTTSTVEVCRCEDVELELCHPLGTLQVDECVAPVRVRYAERDHVGRVYHQNSPGLSIGWGGPECRLRAVGSAGPAQFCTRLGPAGAGEPLITDAVCRDGSEYLVEPPARAPASAVQPDAEAAAAAAGEERRLRAEQQRQAGNDMFRANDFMQAAMHYTESVQLDPAVGAVWANRSQCWLKLGDYERALADAVRCTEVEPANPKGWFRKGVSLHAMQRFPEALPALLEAERREPQSKQVAEAIRMAQLMARKSAAGA